MFDSCFKKPKTKKKLCMVQFCLFGIHNSSHNDYMTRREAEMKFAGGCVLLRSNFLQWHVHYGRILFSQLLETNPEYQACRSDLVTLKDHIYACWV